MHVSRVCSNVLIYAIALAVPSSTWGVVYVSGDATGANDGTSWTDAYTDLQTALASTTLGEIWIKSGIYTPGTGRTASFAMKSNVAIYGGFAGTEDPATFDLADRDLQANETILSGDLNGDDDTGGDSSDNCYHVFLHPYGISLNSTAILDGVTIVGGNANGDAYPYNYGGGMCNQDDNSSPTLMNCTFRNNRAAATGGAVSIKQDATVINCIFDRNTAARAGAVSVSQSRSTSLVSFTGCRFVENTATEYYGGAIYHSVWYTAKVVITDCLFEGNTAQGVGGAVCNYCGSGIMEIRDSVFERNVSYDQFTEGGGGIMFEGDRLTVTRCLFTDNIAYRGAAIRTQYTIADITNCRFHGNTSSDTGAALFNRMSTIHVTNCVMSHNVAAHAPAARNSDSDVTFRNCTVIDNTSISDGGALAADQGSDTATVDIANCILWGNENAQGTYEAAQIELSGGSTLIINTSTVQGWTGGYGGTANSGTDPLLVPDDLLGRLLPDSPMIDAGDNAVVPPDVGDVDDDGDVGEILPLDLLAGPRFVDVPFVPDTGGGGVPLVDIGAIEFIEDCNANGVFDACELDCGEPGGPCDVDGCGADTDCDGNLTPDSCQVDTDADGVIDVCDDNDDNDPYPDAEDNCPLVANTDQRDDDDDGIGDACDDCPSTIPGITVDAMGCPPWVAGDMDRDGDVDMEDFGVMQVCLSGSTVPQTTPACEGAKLDDDSDVDRDDMAIFVRCLSATNIAGDPACMQ